MIRVSFLYFFSFHFFFFVIFCYFTLLLIFTKNHYIIIFYFFLRNFIFYFLMYRDVPGFSGMFRVTGLIDAHEPGWPGLSGWLALPRWLLSRYYMKRACPEPPFLHRDWKQCACHFYIEIWSNVHEQCVTRCSGESRGTRLPLIFRLKWDPKGRKN